MIIFDTTRIAKTTGNIRTYDVRKATLEYYLTHSICEICGSADKVSVHHIKALRSFPELGTDKANMISLCDNRDNPSSCHLKHGHLGDWNIVNTNIEKLRKVF
jgi:predicted restriction endonuclease